MHQHLRVVKICRDSTVELLLLWCALRGPHPHRLSGRCATDRIGGCVRLRIHLQRLTAVRVCLTLLKHSGGRGDFLVEQALSEWFDPCGWNVLFAVVDVGRVSVAGEGERGQFGVVHVHVTANAVQRAAGGSSSGDLSGEWG